MSSLIELRDQSSSTVYHVHKVAGLIRTLTLALFAITEHLELIQPIQFNIFSVHNTECGRVIQITRIFGYDF